MLQSRRRPKCAGGVQGELLENEIKMRSFYFASAYKRPKNSVQIRILSTFAD